MKKLIAIVGPTASGKTQLAIHLAKVLKTEIINCDSRQIYKDFNIATAKPSKEQLLEVPHHLVDFLSPFQSFNVKDFEILANKIIENIPGVVILAGGTGLYFQSIEKNLDNIPSIPNEIRESIQKNYEKFGKEYLLEQLKQKDPAVLTRIDIQNPRRLSRALEVFLTTGKSILEFWGNNQTPKKYDIFWLGIDLGWEQLEQNIQQRIEQMFLCGLVEETKFLVKKYPLNLKSFEAIGYLEVVDYLKRKLTLEQVKKIMFTKTRQYAKRQLTWFRKNQNICWINKLDWAEIEKRVEQFLSKNP